MAGGQAEEDEEEEEAKRHRHVLKPPPPSFSLITDAAMVLINGRSYQLGLRCECPSWFSSSGKLDDRCDLTYQCPLDPAVTNVPFL